MRLCCRLVLAKFINEPRAGLVSTDFFCWEDWRKTTPFCREAFCCTVLLTSNSCKSISNLPTRKKIRASQTYLVNFGYLISFGMLLTLGNPWHEGDRSKDMVKRISEDAMKKLASLTDAGRSGWDQTFFLQKDFWE